LDSISFRSELACAQELDTRDELAPLRAAFVTPDPDLIYLDGNSLGRLPRRAVERLRQAVDCEWGHHLIQSWNANWFEAPSRAGAKIAAIVGADADQVIVSDSTTVNLFKLALAALKIQAGRPRIASDALNFPSDLYVLQGCAELLGQGHSLHLVPSRDGIGVDCQDLSAALDEKTALLSLSHVTFKSGFLYDMQAVTQQAHEAGALVLWDLSHSVGVVPMQLDRWGVDLAVGCTYKYLNGGPGAPAFLYVRRDLLERVVSPIWGWFGQQAPFAFDLGYVPAAGIQRFLVGTPPILSLLAMESALDLTLQAGLDRIRRKSVLLSAYCVYLFDELLAPLGFSLGSPRDPGLRGSHVSICHPDGYRINRALIAKNVLADFREPDNIRIGMAPLYTSFADVWGAVNRLRETVEEGHYLRESAARQPVT
jgi:kynureninase